MSALVGFMAQDLASFHGPFSEHMGRNGGRDLDIRTQTHTAFKTEGRWSPLFMAALLDVSLLLTLRAQ